MSTVSLSRCPSYDPNAIAQSVNAALSPLGGMAAFVAPGQRVLLKVNLLSRATPERAVTTHPEIVRALIHEVRSAGGVVTVGDSPGGRNSLQAIRKLWDETGIARVCAEEDTPLVLFDDDYVSAPSPGGKLYTSFTIGRAVAETDVLISVPKLKTHGLMMLTGAVKNLFGCIPGLEKAQFHVKVPAREDFADMLLDLMLACKPRLVVMDAVVGMEGAGPAGGDPRHIGAILASADSVAVDIIAAGIAGLAPHEVYTNLMAARRGLGASSAAEVETVGADWRELAPPDFALPAPDVTTNMPGWLARRLASWATARPELARASACTRCGGCENNCPVGAVKVAQNGPVFDHATCIRCYCCQELCPTQAIDLTVPPLARLVSRRRGRG
jgi:uncharacterized protein (DUF362 family)/Pyruvate/2-oxoacid:ferredoxin oxidoreductase delta subunit